MLSLRMARRCHHRNRRRPIPRPQPTWPRPLEHRRSRHGAHPAHEFAFTTLHKNGREETQWTYQFDQIATGTQVTESYEFMWCPITNRIAELPIPRYRQLRRGIIETLTRKGSSRTQRVSLRSFPIRLIGVLSAELGSRAVAVLRRTLSQRTDLPGRTCALSMTCCHRASRCPSMASPWRRGWGFREIGR